MRHHHIIVKHLTYTYERSLLDMRFNARRATVTDDAILTVDNNGHTEIKVIWARGFKVARFIMSEPAIILLLLHGSSPQITLIDSQDDIKPFLNMLPIDLAENVAAALEELNKVTKNGKKKAKAKKARA